MNIRKQIGVWLLGVVAAVSGVPAANAALVSLAGTNVTYSFDDAQFAGFGAFFSVSGDTLVIDFTNFKAEDASALTALTTRNGTFVIDVESNSSSALSNLSLLENGDYQLFDFTPGGVGPAALVSGEFRVRNLNNAAQLDTIALNSGALVTLSDFFNSPTTNPWSVTAATTLVPTWNTLEARITLQNLLRALSQGDDYAFIEKKLVTITATVVPVPAAVWLLGSALLGISIVARRRAA
jgi:hypothetical protein